MVNDLKTYNFSSFYFGMCVNGDLIFVVFSWWILLKSKFLVQLCVCIFKSSLKFVRIKRVLCRREWENEINWVQLYEFNAGMVTRDVGLILNECVPIINSSSLIFLIPIPNASFLIIKHFPLIHFYLED